MQVLFGGAVGQCCAPITACLTTGTGVCSDYNGDQSACLGGPKGYQYTQYAKRCKTFSCPTCSCSEYEKDANNASYLCIEYFTCAYVGGYCTKSSAFTGGMPANVTGFYSCAHNCV